MLMMSASTYKSCGTISETIRKSKSSSNYTSKSCIHLKWYTSFNLIRHVLAKHEYECTSKWKNQISWYLPRIMYNPLKTYIGQYSRETEPRSIINTHMKLLYMWGPIYICQPLIMVWCPNLLAPNVSKSSNHECSRPQFCNLQHTGC
jgi:hypothetical protein